MECWILVAAVGLLAGLLWSERKGYRGGVLAFKTPLSLLFVATVSLQAFVSPVYHGLLLAGLVFCLFGDVLLALPGEKAFLAGLVSFLLGHVLYIPAFLAAVGAGPWTLAALVPVGIAGWLVWRWLGPHLGGMRIPVAVYILVISLMVCSAAGFVGASNLLRPGRILVIAGALAFYVSDIFVARDRFVHNGFENRLIGLPLYYGGQYMLAFSPGFLF